jgi:hypothetical protein
MAKRFLIYFFILSFSLVFSQEKNLKAVLISSQKIDADAFVGVDGLDNMYFIKNNILFKKNKEETWQYENISLGNITQVDIQNPLKIILLYENFNTIVLLDNQLNETQKINFSENTIPILVSAMGIASQNKLWIFDSISQQMGLFDYLKNTFKPIAPSFKGNFKYSESDFNTFQWIDDKLNWNSCDIFGKITTLGKTADFDQIQFVNEHAILFLKDEKLYLQDLQKNTISLIKNVKKSMKKIQYKDQILTIFTSQEIINYKIIIP